MLLFLAPDVYQNSLPTQLLLLILLLTPDIHGRWTTGTLPRQSPIPFPISPRDLGEKMVVFVFVFIYHFMVFLFDCLFSDVYRTAQIILCFILYMLYHDTFYISILQFN